MVTSPQGITDHYYSQEFTAVEVCAEDVQAELKMEG